MLEFFKLSFLYNIISFLSYYLVNFLKKIHRSAIQIYLGFFLLVVTRLYFKGIHNV